MSCANRILSLSPRAARMSYLFFSACLVLNAPAAAGDDACCDGIHAPAELVFSCHPSVRGRMNSVLKGGPLLVEAAPADAAAMFNPWPWATIDSNGATTNRIDIVFVGDGFQTAQLASYASLVDQRWATIRTREPWVSYQRYFNAHRVDVSSIDSGVDNDPTLGVVRTTALDMGFW